MLGRLATHGVEEWNVGMPDYVCKRVKKAMLKGKKLFKNRCCGRLPSHDEPFRKLEPAGHIYPKVEEENLDVIVKV